MTPVVAQPLQLRSNFFRLKQGVFADRKYFFSGALIKAFTVVLSSDQKLVKMWPGGTLHVVVGTLKKKKTQEGV